jgi:hypothetical protein
MGCFRLTGDALDKFTVRDCFRPPTLFVGVIGREDRHGLYISYNGIPRVSSA